APRAARFAAVFPAPPGCSVVRCLRTTGTGASGDNHEACPHQYQSRMTPPRTIISCPGNFLRMSASPTRAYSNIESLFAIHKMNPGEKILSLEQMDEWVSAETAAGRRIGFTCGSFALLHAGHVQ